MNKKKKINYQTLISEVIFMVLGILIGIRIKRYGLYVGIILLISLFILMYIQIIIHELGHLIFGLISKYKFLSFRIGNMMLVKEKGKFKIKRLSLAGTSGQCLMAPPKIKNDKIPYILYNLGGVLNNILFSIILFILYIILPKCIFTEIMLFCSLIGFTYAIINGIPIGGIVDNDGKNIISISKSKEAINAFYKQLKINEELTNGNRLKDMDEDLFISSKSDNNIISTIQVFKCNRLIDLHEFDSAKVIIQNLIKEEKILDLYRNLLICDLIYCKIILNDNEDEIKELLTNEQKKFMKVMKDYLSVIRCEYAYKLMIEDNKEEALKIKEKFEKYIKSYPYIGDVLSESELIDIVDKQKNVVYKL